MDEIFKDVVGYEGYYKVSNHGRVERNNKILTPLDDTNGYVSVCLCVKSKIKRRQIHRLVAEVFIPNPENKRTVNHKDGVKTNNRIKNLEWNTYSENLKHAIDVLGRKPPMTYLGKFGKNHNRSKSFKIKFPNGDEKVFYSGLEFERKTGLDHTNISYTRSKGKPLPYLFKRGKIKGLILLEC